MIFNSHNHRLRQKADIDNEKYGMNFSKNPEKFLSNFCDVDFGCHILHCQESSILCHICHMYMQCSLIINFINFAFISCF